MVGRPQTQAKRAELEEQVRALQAEILTLRQRAGFLDFEPGQPRTFSQETKQGLAREMLAMSDEGLSIDEICAKWNIDAETFGEWCRGDVEFATVAARARTRGRAAVIGSMRRLMESGRGMPAAFSDRMLALHDAGYGDDGGGDGLITVALPTPSDCQSCPHCGADLGGHGDRQTQSESDAA